MAPSDTPSPSPERSVPKKRPKSQPARRPRLTETLVKMKSAQEFVSTTQPMRPNKYRVLLLNDDYTPMDFVIHILQHFFHKNLAEATNVMLQVHHHGVGECGVYTYEVAETKVTQVMDFSRKCHHPLQCVMEKMKETKGNKNERS